MLNWILFTSLDKSDLVLCQYLTDNKSNCVDNWLVCRVFGFYIQYSGTNNVSLAKGTIIQLATTFTPFKTLITWEFTKDLTKLDDYDWKDFVNWKTNKDFVIGIWGNNVSTEMFLIIKIYPQLVFLLLMELGYLP